MQGAKQIFQVHQLPEHPETIKRLDLMIDEDTDPCGSHSLHLAFFRESFTKVIYHLCGYFTNQQINDFLVK